MSIAIIGCGAITESFYLPAFAQSSVGECNLVLVDSDLERAKRLAGTLQRSSFVSDWRTIVSHVQGAIVAVPHHLHFPIARELLFAGIHVLCEKPLAETSHEAAQLVDVARNNWVTLSVNHTRRLMASSIAVKKLLSQEAIGEVRSIKYLDGTEFNWPTASGFYFNSSSQKGVLLDLGSHVLDLVCWWLGGKPKVTLSENDSFGGSEAVSRLKLAYDTCAIDVRLSRLSKLANKFWIKGSRGQIEGLVYDPSVLFLRIEGQRDAKRVPLVRTTLPELGQQLVRNFIRVAKGETSPLIPASAILDSVDVIDNAYHQAVRFDLPWYKVLENASV